MQTNGYLRKPAWAPAQVRLPSPIMNRPSLGQTGGFLESPLLAFTLDTWTALTAGYLGWAYGRRGNDWGTFWYVVAALASFKALHDLGRLGK